MIDIEREAEQIANGRTLYSSRDITADIIDLCARAERERCAKDARPEGWQWTHEHDAELIRRDGFMCEQHPGVEFPHDDCAGPGQAWIIEGRANIATALATTEADAYARGRAEAKAEDAAIARRDTDSQQPHAYLGRQAALRIEAAILASSSGPCPTCKSDQRDFRNLGCGGDFGVLHDNCGTQACPDAWHNSGPTLSERIRGEIAEKVKALPIEVERDDVLNVNKNAMVRLDDVLAAIKQESGK